MSIFNTHTFIIYDVSNLSNVFYFIISLAVQGQLSHFLEQKAMVLRYPAAKMVLLYNDSLIML